MNKDNKTKITLTAESDLKDRRAREMIDIIFTKIQTINERTKIHTIQIKELKKELTKLKNKNEK